MRALSVFAALTATFCASAALAQYTPSAGRSAPAVQEKRQVRDESTGTVKEETVQVRPKSDQYGNAQGNQFDLAVDGAFSGQTIAVIQLYSFSLDDVKAALAQKGFSVYRWSNSPPSPAELEKALAKSCQLWIISGGSLQLNDQHLAVIKRFFEAGHGLYIWGDNDPYFADANFVGNAVFSTSMHGDTPGGQVVGMNEGKKAPGLTPNLLLTTGLEHVFEGITIATVEASQTLKPLIYGSAGNLVAAFYDRDGKRAIFDGGFTRLYNNWDTAGTARYVKNAAAWLANSERFGTKVSADAAPAKPAKAD
jgi:hypothetical protein